MEYSKKMLNVTPNHDTYLRQERLNSDCHQFHQNQQN